MTLLANGDQDRASCPACGALVRHVDIYTAGSLSATSKGALPGHLQDALLGAKEEQLTERFARSSSKIRSLVEVAVRLIGMNISVCSH
jgi:hypothetical protein